MLELSGGRGKWDKRFGRNGLKLEKRVGSDQQAIPGRKLCWGDYGLDIYVHVLDGCHSLLVWRNENISPKARAEKLKFCAVLDQSPREHVERFVAKYLDECQLGNMYYPSTSANVESSSMRVEVVVWDKPTPLVLQAPSALLGWKH